LTYFLVLGGLLLLYFCLRPLSNPFALTIVIGGITAFAAMRGDQVDRDYPSYFTLYMDSTVHADARGWAEFGYFGMQNFFSAHEVPFAAFLGVVGLLAIGTKVLALALNDREHIGIGLVVYFSTYLMLHDMTQVRVSVSSGLFLLSLVALREKRNAWFVLLNASAIAFHSSSALGFVALLLCYRPRRNEALFFAVVPFFLTGLGLIGALNGLAALVGGLVPDGRIELYMTLSEQGTYAEINLLSIGFLTLAVLNAVLWLQSRSGESEVSGRDLLYLRVFSVGIVCYPLFSALPVLAFRTSEYLCIVVLFLAQRHFRPQRHPAATALVVLYLISALYVNIVRDESLLAPYSTEIHEI